VAASDRDGVSLVHLPEVLAAFHGVLQEPLVDAEAEPAVHLHGVVADPGEELA
jgi:hypothetical protein